MQPEEEIVERDSSLKQTTNNLFRRQVFDRFHQVNGFNVSHVVGMRRESDTVFIHVLFHLKCLRSVLMKPIRAQGFAHSL